MTQVWKAEGWSNIPLKDTWDAIMERSLSAPRVGELTLPQLMTLSLQGDKSPVGIYIFTNDEDIYYVGKTHGRSLAERLICHLDSRSVAPDEVRIVQEGDTWESIARDRGATQAKIKKFNKGVELKPGARIRLTANWTMSSLVGKMVEKKEAATRTEAVAKVMDMRTIWMQVTPPEAAPMRHQEHVDLRRGYASAHAPRQLLRVRERTVLRSTSSKYGREARPDKPGWMPQSSSTFLPL